MGKGMKLFGFVKGWKSKRSENAENYALDILPAEIWTMILENVETFEDRWNCFNTCYAWRNILENLEPVYSWGIDKVLSGIIKHLDAQSVLTCRQVSKKWCDSVDNLAANNSKLRPYTSNKQDASIPPALHGTHFTSPSWNLSSVAKIQQLIDDLDNYPTEEKCPIVGRYLQMPYLTADADDEEIPAEQIDEHQDLACTLIRSMGQHVYYYNLTYDPRQTSPVLLSMLISRQFLYLTNLRMLKLDHRVVIPSPWTAGDHERLVPHFRRSPLPHLESLESLILPLQSSGIPLLLQYQLVYVHSAHLKRLQIPLARLTANLFQRLVSLTELSTIIGSDGDIRTLLLCTGPLQKLSIVLELATCLLAEYLLEVVAHFPQLDELKLRMIANCKLQDSNDSLYKHWKCSVRKVYIDVDVDEEEDKNGWEYESLHSRISFNFLEWFSAVEHVVIVKRVLCPVVSRIADAIDNSGILGGLLFSSRRRRRYFPESVLLKDFMHSGRMYKSNAWKVLPRLETFHYQWLGHPTGYLEHFYCRLEYERLRRHKNKFSRRAGRVLERFFIGTINLFLS